MSEEQFESLQEMKNEEQYEESKSGESFMDGAQSKIQKESKESKREWSTQASESGNEKERQNGSQETFFIVIPFTGMNKRSERVVTFMFFSSVDL